MTPTRSQRENILGKIKAQVSEKYFDPAFNEAAWNATVERHRGTVVDANTTLAFENAIAAMLAELSPRTLGLLSDHTPITPRNAINASFSVHAVSGSPRWDSRNVLPGGVAARAGIKPGDVLLSAGDKPLQPSPTNGHMPTFEMHQQIPVVISRGNPPKEMTLTLETATPKYKDNPYSEPTALSAGSQAGEIAYLRVSLFPGKIGIDFANELDSIFGGRFQNADRLIVDLRGNPGGGIGGLTLMSYLTPDRRAIGYSKNRRIARQDADPDMLPVFDKVPRSKLAIPGLASNSSERFGVSLHRSSRPPRLPWTDHDPRE